jgi:hypothetical protein
MKKLKTNTIPYLLMALLLQISSLAATQEISKEVYVVRPYEPTLSDASKYNFMPETDDISTELPSFRYSVTPKKLENSFVPEPIKPARTSATSLPKIYKSWIKLGLGNYSTPLAEFNISNLRSRDVAYGAYFYHKSSLGNVKLLNDEKVSAKYGDNTVNLYGKKFLEDATVSANLLFDHRGYNFYGYNTELFNDSVPLIHEDSLRQNVYRAGFDMGVHSDYTDSTHLNYDINAHYDYFWDKFNSKENNFRLNAGLNKNFNGLQAGLDVSVDHTSLTATSDSVKNTVVSVKPWISKRNRDWMFMLGLEAVADNADISHFYLYPHASLDIIIIENVLVPFIGLSGELEKNTYSNLQSENPYIIPGLYLKNASSNLIVTGGLKGSITPSVHFRADVTYRVVKDMHFFVNDTQSDLQNQFTGVYDDVDQVTYHGQVTVEPSAAWRFMIDARYNRYHVFEQIKPWHKPEYEIDLDVAARLGSKITMASTFTVIGTRWVPGFEPSVEKQKLKPVADINFRFNYHYSKALSVFADLYNVAGRSYLLWNYYPSQRFNFMFGISYKL